MNADRQKDTLWVSQDSVLPVKPGDVLVVAGSVGQIGGRVLLEAEKKLLSSWFSPEYIDRILQNWEEQPVEAALFQRKYKEAFGIHGVQPVEEGGILRAVWELSGRYNVGVSFSLPSIPVRQWVIEVCEHCEANPYRLWSGNCLLLAAEHGWQMAQTLKAWGIEAEVIGAVEDGIARKICHDEEIGYLERPREDELYRLLGREAAKPFMNTVMQEKNTRRNRHERENSGSY